MLTVNEVVQVLPAHLKTAATQSLVDKINGITTDPEIAENIRQNFISYTSVLKEGRFKTEDYLNAVAYVSYKIMGYTNQDSYRRTFKDRYAVLVAKGCTDKDISAYVAAYNKNKLVNLIYEQTLIPSHVLNQGIHQAAINTQADLMVNAMSEKVRTEAANSLLTHLKQPEKKKIELSIGMEESSGMGELKDMLSSLAQQQQDLITAGVSTKSIAHQKLGGDVIEAKVVPEPVVTPKHTTSKKPLGKNPLTSFKTGGAK